MPRDAYRRRYDRLAQDSGQARVVALHAQSQRTQHEARLRRALATAVAAGIEPDQAYPPVLRGLSALGLRLRPVHFQPIWQLVLAGAVFGLVPVGLTGAAVQATGGANGPLAVLHEAGLPAALLVVLGLGAVNAALIRLKAQRARLPDWGQI